MATILLKNVPEELRQRLKERALRNRRSMNQEALELLEHSLPKPLEVKAILAWKPVKLKIPIDWTQAVRGSRDERDSRDQKTVEDLYGKTSVPRAPMAADGPARQRRKRR